MMVLAKTISPYVMLGVGIAGVSMLSTKNNREKFFNTFSKVKTRALNFWQKKQSEMDKLLEKAGHPDPYDIGDSRMVEEGAMTGIHYYNNNQ